MNSEYFVTIGLEIHAELKTTSKMWCGCKNDPDSMTPNAHTCPICMAHPGTLPVPNLEAMRKVAQVGLAIGANIADFTEFDRKNYFYPDIPKGYQISQYKYPIVSGGRLAGVDITRIHLEEDTAKSLHDQGDFSLIDFNRAGVPLMELVTEPCIHDAETAVRFAKELQLILRFLNASDANLDLGQMRVEVNLSVSKDPKVFGTKVEVKNLNSFKTVEKAIEYEITRHIGVIEEGGKIVQETRGWDEEKQATFSQRKKENAMDYRYFPDPDIPKFYLSKLFDLEDMKKNLPELPHERRARFSSLGLKDDQVEILTGEKALASFVDSLGIEKKDSLVLAVNYLLSDVLGNLKKEGKEISASNLPNPHAMKQLMTLIEGQKLSSRGAKDLLVSGELNQEVEVEKLAESKGLIQKNDPEALRKIVEEVIEQNQKEWSDYKAGNEKLLMFFTGLCMKASKGSGNPTLFQEILKNK